MASFRDDTPTTLLDLLSNSLILRHTTPYLPLPSILALSDTSKEYRMLLTKSCQSDAFRYLDLSRSRKANVKVPGPIDRGGMSWRTERMDEALTEDEFYSGPLRGIFSRLQKQNLLINVQTLILDGLSVPADLVRDIIAEDRYNVRVLSVREAKHLNERKLMQVLKYAVRPSRSEGTPRLKGLYIFGPKDPTPIDPKYSRSHTPSPEESVNGAQISAEWNQRSTVALEAALSYQNAPEKWYSSAGRMFGRYKCVEWGETLKACEGIIQFDAVLCRGPRHDIPKAFDSSASSGHQNDAAHDYSPPAVANIAMGASGCHTCNSCPEGKAIFGMSPSTYFPLLSPPPLQASTIRAAQTPCNANESPALILRCEDCLRDRWCERCNTWWCEDDYSGLRTPFRTYSQAEIERISKPGPAAFDESKRTKDGEEAKIRVKRECFGCGPVCGDCKQLYIRACRRCRNEYCVVDNEGSSAVMCDWCNSTARRTRDMY